MATFGNTTAEVNSDVGNRRLIHANRFQAPATGTITSLSIYMEGAGEGRQAQLAVYSDNAGAPNTLLASTAGQSVTSNGWQTFTTISCAITNGLYYWLAFVTDSDALTQRYGTGIANQHCYASLGEGETYYEALPATFPSGIYGTALFSIYATYIEEDTPTTGYPFIYYMANASDILPGNPTTVVVNADLSTVVGTTTFGTYTGAGLQLRAAYGDTLGTVQWDLIIESVANGTTDPLAGTHQYYNSKFASVVAHPDPSYHLDKWILTSLYGSMNISSNDFTVVMNKDYTIKPVFVADTAGLIWGFDYWDGAAWIAIGNATLTQIVEELNGDERASFTIPNTSSARTTLHLDDPDATDVFVRITFKNSEIFLGILTGAQYSSGQLKCLLYNYVFSKLKQAPNPVTFTSSAMEPLSAVGAILQYAGLGTYIFPQSLGSYTLHNYSLKFESSNAYDGAKSVAEAAGIYMWGNTIGGEGYGILNIGVRDATIHSTTGLKLLDGTQKIMDRSKRYTKVIVKGKDITTGSTIQGEAGTTGSTKIFAYVKPTDTVTLTSIATKKLETVNSATASINLSMLTEDVYTWKPGQYVSINRADLCMAGTYIIHRITKTPTVAEVEVEVPTAQYDADVKEITDNTQDIILNL